MVPYACRPRDRMPKARTISGFHYTICPPGETQKPITHRDRVRADCREDHRVSSRAKRSKVEASRCEPGVRRGFAQISPLGLCPVRLRSGQALGQNDRPWEGRTVGWPDFLPMPFAQEPVRSAWPLSSQTRRMGFSPCCLFPAYQSAWAEAHPTVHSCAFSPVSSQWSSRRMTSAMSTRQSPLISPAMIVSQRGWPK